MLEEIRVENLLILDEAEVTLHPGLNVVSGETGVGKSLFLSAVNALFGNKISSSGVEGRVTRIEGRFRLDEAARLSLADDLVDDAEDDLVIRVMKREGGSQRAYLDGAIISRRELARLAGRLVDVHGQRDLQRLLDESEQVGVLDLYAGGSELARQFAERHREVAQLEVKLRDRAELERRLRGELEVARYQSEELERFNPQPGERAELEALHRRLDGAAEIVRGVDAVVALLDDDEEGAAQKLGRAQGLVEKMVDLDPELASLAERLDALRGEADDIARAAFSLGRERGRFDADPAEVAARLDQFNALLRKHGVDDEGLETRREELREAVDRLEAELLGVEHLEEDLAAARKARLDLGRKLAKKRESAGKELRREVEAELAELALPKAQFRVASGLDALEAENPEVGPRGFGRPRFELKTNPGRPWADLVDSASGGELSRILLALKSVLAARHGMPLMIFDEIETGVGPRLGTVLGRRLARLARHRQVLCITHFPQIAAFADRHLKIEKEQDGERSRARVEVIEGEARRGELAEMLGGGDRKLALKQADSLLAEARGESESVAAEGTS
jgi:DNA repair protein RecN (Recombination protein N)